MKYPASYYLINSMGWIFNVIIYFLPGFNFVSFIKRQRIETLKIFSLVIGLVHTIFWVLSGSLNNNPIIYICNAIGMLICLVFLGFYWYSWKKQSQSSEIEPIFTNSFAKIQMESIND